MPEAEDADNAAMPEMQLQLVQLTAENFPQFQKLLPYRDWSPGRPQPRAMPEERAREMLALSCDPNSGCKVWLMLNQHDLAPVGVITIMPVFHQGCRQLGYWVLPQYHGQNFATLAVGAISKVCFERLNIARLQAQVVADNPASIRVLEKAGFVCEAMLPASHQIDGQVVDAFLYGKVNA